MTMHTLTGQDWVDLIAAAAAALNQQRDALDDLDRALGDGDHGYNLAAGLAAAAEDVAALEHPSPRAALFQAGTSIRNKMGGASGSVFGAFFRGAARSLGESDLMSAADLATSFEGGLAQVQKRGHAQPGDKTMVDALAPAVAEMVAAHRAGAHPAEMMGRAAAAAAAGASKTEHLVARFGRAKFLGERAIGHRDAGAVSIAILLKAWADFLPE